MYHRNSIICTFNIETILNGEEHKQWKDIRTNEREKRKISKRVTLVNDMSKESTSVGRFSILSGVAPKDRTKRTRS